jgi:hypothetical protein
MKELMTAIAAFQKECPVIKKDTANDFAKYKYADLPAILDIINPILQKNNLVLTQALESDETGRYIRTTLYHLSSEQKIESKIDIPLVSMKGMNDYQALGSGITYLRRYSLSILGIVTEEDNDAAGEQTKTAKKSDTSAKKLPDLWLNREVPRNSGKITKEWYNAVAYLRGEIPREDGAEPKMADLEARYKISRANKDDLMADVMDEISFPVAEGVPVLAKDDEPPY